MDVKWYTVDTTPVGKSDQTLATIIRSHAKMLSNAIAQAKQAGLSVDVQWRLEDDTAEITIVREY